MDEKDILREYMKYCCGVSNCSLYISISLHHHTTKPVPVAHRLCKSNMDATDPELLHHGLDCWEARQYSSTKVWSRSSLHSMVPKNISLPQHQLTSDRLHDVRLQTQQSLKLIAHRSSFEEDTGLDNISESSWKQLKAVENLEKQLKDLGRLVLVVPYLKNAHSAHWFTL